MANILLIFKTYLAGYVRKIRVRGVNSLVRRGLIVGKHFQFEKGLLIDKIYPHLITIGDDVIVGAGSVVTKNIPSNSVAVGNPAKVIKQLDKFIEKTVEKAKHSPVFENELYTTLNLTNERKQEMKDKLKNGTGYFKTKTYDKFRLLD